MNFPSHMVQIEDNCISIYFSICSYSFVKCKEYKNYNFDMVESYNYHKLVKCNLNYKHNFISLT